MQKLSSTRRKINEHCDVKDKFPPDAYEFVTACVIEQVNALEQPRHLSALELLQGIQKQFIDNFGPLAEMVVDSWNIRTASDIGEIVFDLIELKILSVSEEDKRSDFDIDYCFFPPRKKSGRKKLNREIPKID